MCTGSIEDNLRSAGWDVKGAMFLVMDRKTRCKLGLDLQGQVGVATTQNQATLELSRFDMLICEQSEAWKNNFLINLATCLADREAQKPHRKFKT